MKKALITGITGQDGSFLAELLLENGYEVHGIIRRVALEDPAHRLWRIRHLVERVQLHAGSLESYASLVRVVADVRPDEVYHLASQSFVSYSFEDEFSTINTNVAGTHYLLSAVREMSPGSRVYFAGSSEMFGAAAESPQNESTPFHPRSPYGISKVAGFHLTRNYREAYGLFACNGILFNHESERRGFEFVTRKVSQGAARIKCGLQDRLKLGNLEACRDWGYAPDYVRAMWLMLQEDRADDYVVATGVSHSVAELAEVAFAAVGLDWREYVEIDPGLFRPAEVHELRGDASKARHVLGWEPTVGFEEMVSRMVEADLTNVREAAS